MSPDELLDELSRSASTRKRKSLEAINDACREQHERGDKDFSIPTIARLARSRGGPVAGTIRNKTGADFQALIRAWAKHTGGSARKLPKVSEDPIMSLVNKIEDPAIRSVMGGVIAENRKLRGEINILKHEVSESSYIDLRKPTPSKDNATTLISSSIGLLPSEIEAISHSISPEKLVDEGWKLDQDGRVCNDKGRAIFPIGFLSGLRKVIDSERSRQ